MNISKRKQGILAIICTIAMIVTSITVYNPTEVKADPSATVDGKQYSAIVKDRGEWTGFDCQGIFDSARIHFAWGIDVDSNTITASIGETNLTVNGKSAKGMNIPLSEVTSLGVGSYDIVINATTVASESAEAKEISATATLKIEKAEGTAKPSAPVGLVANIDATKTNYTISFAAVAGATKYKFYLGEKYIKDITNGGPNGIVTIKELGLEAGKTYKFGVSAVNAAGEESDITTIDVTAPGKEEETTTGSSTKPLDPSDIKDSEWTVALGSKTVSYYIADGKADKVQVKPQLEGDNYYIAFKLDAKFESVTFDGVPKDVTDGAYYRVKVSDLTSGYHTLVVTDHYGKESVTIYFKVAGEEGTTEYTVSIDGKSQTCKEGTKIAVPADGQGYYNVTKKEAYAPGTELKVNENMTLKSIELNVTMTKGASIRLAAPTGLRFQTTVKSGNGIAADEILNSPTVTTGTLITTLDLYKDNGKTLTKDSKYNFLDIANNGWFNNGTSTETGKFCGSIVKIKAQNYGRAYIAVGYATIKYSDGSSKTVYANVTENNAKSIKYVAQQIKDSNKFDGYSAEQKDIIVKYIDGKEISE